jgi:hypothetical protein
MLVIIGAGRKMPRGGTVAMHLALALPRGAGRWCQLVPRRTLSDRANGSVIAVTEGQKFTLRTIKVRGGETATPTRPNDDAIWGSVLNSADLGVC